ncbi:MAG: Rieske (2Fe-2S) protein [Bacilli bacterium]
MKHFVANFEAFLPDTPFLFEHEGQRILLAKKDDKIYAISDKCPHMGTSLMKGTIQEGVVTCKSHNAKIDIVTGEILEKAHIGFIKMPTKKAKVFLVVVEDGKVFVEI